MEALLRFIFFAVLIYYGFKLAAQYIMPWVINRFIKKQQEKFNNMNGFPNATHSNEGKVHVKTKQANKSNTDKDFGEYVDFEDVDD